MINRAIEWLGDMIWGPWTVALVLGAGIWFSSTNGFLQITHIGTWWRRTIGAAVRGGGGTGDAGAISPLQSAMTSLAGTLGTGNIVGVATAMTLGGPGAIFWMWVAALFGMMTAYAENVLGIVFRRRDERGNWLGGPMMYMAHGLGAKGLAALWAMICSVAAFGVGNLTQVNSIAASAQSAWGVPEWVSGIVIAVVAAPAILGGVKSAARLSEKLVPIMAIIYIAGCAAVLILNFSRIPSAFGAIFGNILTPSAAGGGALGAMLAGVRRGVFTNEAGLGSSVMVHSSSDVKEPSTQGMWGIFEVFFDTIVMCTITALVILVSGAMDIRGASGERLDGAALSAAAFSGVFGKLSGSFITLALMLFAFATVIGWSCYGERAFGYLCGTKYTWLYKMAYVLAIIPGSLFEVRTAWALSDLLNGLMAIPNTVAILLLWRIPAQHTRQSVLHKR